MKILLTATRKTEAEPVRKILADPADISHAMQMPTGDTIVNFKGREKGVWVVEGPELIYAAIKVAERQGPVSD